MAPAVILVARIAEKSIAIGALDTFDGDAAAETSLRELAVSGTLGAALVTDHHARHFPAPRDRRCGRTGRPRVRKTLAKLRGRLHGSEGPRKRGECTQQNRREEFRTARFDSVRRPAFVDSAYRTRFSGFAACRDDDWSDAMPSKIEDYAMLGDCETSALVARDGSVDWLCWPRFDSGACFAALLGELEKRPLADRAGETDSRAARRYRENTLILETEIETEDGAATS